MPPTSPRRPVFFNQTNRQVNILGVTQSYDFVIVQNTLGKFSAASQTIQGPPDFFPPRHCGNINRPEPKEKGEDCWLRLAAFSEQLQGQC